VDETVSDITGECILCYSFAVSWNKHVWKNEEFECGAYAEVVASLLC